MTGESNPNATVGVLRAQEHLSRRCYASLMGMVQKLTAMFRGAKTEPAASKPHVPVSVAPVEDLAAYSVRAPVPGPAREPKAPRTIGEQLRTPGPKAPGIKKVTIDDAVLSVLDLRELQSNRFRIVGSAYWVTDSGRYKHGGHDYLLVREPKNKWDPNAVAVYGKGRKVGHLSEAKAAALAPIFDTLPFDAYRVGGAPPTSNSIVMWVDLPTLPKLREFLKLVAV